jgi:hypothetical protein
VPQAVDPAYERVVYQPDFVGNFDDQVPDGAQPGFVEELNVYDIEFGKLVESSVKDASAPSANLSGTTAVPQSLSPALEKPVDRAPKRPLDDMDQAHENEREYRNKRQRHEKEGASQEVVPTINSCLPPFPSPAWVLTANEGSLASSGETTIQTAASVQVQKNSQDALHKAKKAVGAQRNTLVEQSGAPTPGGQDVQVDAAQQSDVRFSQPVPQLPPVIVYEPPQDGSIVAGPVQIGSFTFYNINVVDIEYHWHFIWVSLQAGQGPFADPETQVQC